MNSTSPQPASAAPASWPVSHSSPKLESDSPPVRMPSSDMTAAETRALLDMYLLQQQRQPSANTASFLGSQPSLPMPSASYLGHHPAGLGLSGSYPAQQHLQQPVPPQQVLVLLPSNVNMVNLNLMQVVAETQNKMGRPLSFTDLVLTVAATPLITAAEVQAKKPTMVDAWVQTDSEQGRAQSKIFPTSSAGSSSAEPAISAKLDPAALVAATQSVTASESAPATAAQPPPTHPFPASMVTTYRPAGDGPAPYHVTLRALRPSVTADMLLALVKDAKSFVKLFIPPFAQTFHVGRAATYFFESKAEAFHFCTGLRVRSQELQAEYGLTEAHVQAAKRRGVKGIGFHTKPTKLTITMSDQKKREKMAAHMAAVKQAQMHKQGGGAVTSEEVGEFEEDTEGDTEETVSEAGVGPYEHFMRMAKADPDSNSDSIADLPLPPVSMILPVDHRGVGLSVPRVLLHNVGPSVSNSDMLQLARRCLSLKQIYLPSTTSGNGMRRTAAFCFTDETEAKGFAQYLKMLLDRRAYARQYDLDVDSMDPAALLLGGVSLPKEQKAADMTVEVVCPGQCYA